MYLLHTHTQDDFDWFDFSLKRSRNIVWQKVKTLFIMGHNMRLSKERYEEKKAIAFLYLKLDGRIYLPFFVNILM